VKSREQTLGREPIKVGISACLLGQEVRYDGSSKREPFLVETLGRFFQLVPICPELEAGLGVPREPMHLVGDPANPRLVGNESGADRTRALSRFASRSAREIPRQQLCGFILKARSPSCGLERVPVVGKTGRTRRIGRGLFAGELLRRLPLLPVAEAEGLSDLAARDHFIVRVCGFGRLQDLFTGRCSRRRLLRFHAAQRYLLLAHSPPRARQLDRLVVDMKDYPAAGFRHEYCSRFMAILQVKTTTSKNVNVLQHIMGRLRKVMSPRQRQSLQRAIEDYRHELVPLIVPVTLLNFFLQLHDPAEVEEYLSPPSRELMLRNHA